MANPLITGPSSSASPYIVGVEPNVRFVSIASAGDNIGGSTGLVGVPDGLGAFDNGNGTFTLLVNHEITNTSGGTRAHGSVGSFVSQIVINKSDLSVVSSHDAFDTVYDLNAAGDAYVAITTAFSRFCSGDLPLASAFYNAATGLGTQARIYMNGEETGAEGRAVGTIVTGDNAGDAYVLDYLGKFSWENAVANPYAQNKTIVVGTDDQSPGGQVYVYIGNKTDTGNDIQKAGLANGKLYGIAVPEYGNNTTSGPETSAKNLGDDNLSTFTLVDLGDVHNRTGAQIETASDRPV